ncbi:MAG: hypothetical protein CMJ25_03235 [Phycisphaerae bacterium]|nr:hypothetical protein [Phycisphaerae bacterium]|tara:strand:- start:4466 stop:6817 length:2352 start_codon:yes stop_codon:yes gene_type:complete
MQKIVLYIQPQQTAVLTTEEDFVRLDLMEEELISLTQVIQDVKDIEKLFTDYSRTFNLPASKTNNKIFKHWYNPDVNAFDSQVFSTAKIELNHFEFKTGKIQLNEVVMKQGKPTMYKVTFFGETTDFKNSINEDELSDLSWLNNFSHDYTVANIKGGLENGLNMTADSVTYNDAVIYPLIAHSQSYIYNLNGDHQNPVNISTHNSDQKKRGVLPEDLKPAIQVKLIIKAIQNQYNINFKTGEFFDSAVFNSMYMWLHREKGKIILSKSKSFIGVENSTCGNISGGGTNADCEPLTDMNWTPPSGSPLVGIPNDFRRGWFATTTINTGSALDMQRAGYFYYMADLFMATENHVFTVNVSPTVNTIPYTIEIIRQNNQEVFARSENNTGNSSLSIEIFTDPNSPFSPTGNRLNRVDLHNFATQIFTNGKNIFYARISCKADLTVGLSYDLVRTWTAQVGQGGGTETHSGRMTMNNNVLINSKFITINDQIPKLKVKDFLNGLFRKYNLLARLDYQGELVVETLDSYYESGQTHDITEFVETDQHTVGDAIPFSEVDFEYSEPKSILAQQFELINNQKYGELNFVSVASKKNVYQIKLPFESMIYERLFDQGSGASTSIQIGTFLNIDLQPDLGKPLMFYGINQDSVGTTGINFVNATREDLSNGGHDNETLNNYWIPSAYNELGTSSTPPAYNLNFGSEINTYTLTDYSGTNNSLFQLYYENYITRVFNTRTRIFKFSAILPLKVLLNLTLNDLIVIGTRAYTINKMTTKLQSGETNLELLNEPS